MAENSKIEWTDHTFNPWRGCTKVSPACDLCYAETMSKRNPAVLGVWGKYGTRAIAAESYWKLPEQWNRKAEKEGVRKRVFCASLADVFEGNDTMPESAWPDVYRARYRLFDLIQATPHLDWLLLTKRPELVTSTLSDQGIYGTLSKVMPNVWIGTTVENQKYADERIPHLLKIPATVRFLSIEPLLGPIDFYKTSEVWPPDVNHPWRNEPILHGIHWVIVGGESGGQKARPMDPAWVRSLRDQCVSAGVPFHFKQWGEWVDEMHEAVDTQRHAMSDAFVTLIEDEGPDYLGFYMARVGKQLAGRELDGRTWDEVPEVQHG